MGRDRDEAAFSGFTIADPGFRIPRHSNSICAAPGCSPFSSTSLSARPRRTSSASPRPPSSGAMSRAHALRFPGSGPFSRRPRSPRFSCATRAEAAPAAGSRWGPAFPTGVRPESGARSAEIFPRSSRSGTSTTPGPCSRTRRRPAVATGGPVRVSCAPHERSERPRVPAVPHREPFVPVSVVNIRMKLRNAFLAVSLVAAAVPLSAAPEEIFEKAYSMDGVTKIQVENVNGHIEATAWDKPYFKLRAVKRADGGRAEDTLKLTEIRVSKVGDSIKVETINPKRRRLFGFLDFGGPNAHVDYTLQMPALP